MKKFLLPSGFRDQLNDDAELEFMALVKILNYFSEQSYKKISPPTIEFESSEAYESSSDGFKFLDPISQQTLVLRQDITPQIARVAASRLTHEVLPLKLCYYGDIFRASGMNTQADRQGKQVGAELISAAETSKNDIEIIGLAIASLSQLGLKNITIDLNTPNLVSVLDQDFSAEELAALSKKEYFKLPSILRGLTEFSGAASKALGVLSSPLAAELSDAAKAQITYVAEVFAALSQTHPETNFTIDFVENRKTSYQEKLSFSIFCEGARDEIGRGGKYKIATDDKTLFATGFSLYLNNFLQAVEI